MKTSLIVIDAQESFRQRPYFTDADLPAYIAAQNTLIDGCMAQGVLPGRHPDLRHAAAGWLGADRNRHQGAPPRCSKTALPPFAACHRLWREPFRHSWKRTYFKLKRETAGPPRNHRLMAAIVLSRATHASMAFRSSRYSGRRMTRHALQLIAPCWLKVPGVARALLCKYFPIQHP